MIKISVLDMINTGILPKVLLHIDVCLAVRFLRRVDSSDYIDLSYLEIFWKGDLYICLPLVT